MSAPQGSLADYAAASPDVLLAVVMVSILAALPGVALMATTLYLGNRAETHRRASTTETDRNT